MRGALLVIGALCAAALAGATPGSTEPAVDEAPGAAASAAADRATAAFVAGDCQLCHAVPGVPEPPREVGCASCHQWIRDVSRDPRRREVALGYFPDWERYERHVRSYMQVPSMDAAMARLDPAWVGRWLGDPHDIRPALDEGMPRLGLDADAIGAIVSAFAARQQPVPRQPRPAKKNVDTGRARYLTAGCPSCHGFGGAVPASPGIASAPDLAHTRERMEPDRAVAWILDPRSLSPHATMPSFDVDVDDAVAIRDFLYLADAAWTEAPALSLAAIPPATRPVRWAEVRDRVFGRICAHCHMDPTHPDNPGRAGPGNDGGFGWPASGVQLQTREGVMAHADAIVPALMRRRAEAHRDHVAPGQRPAEVERPARPGMPLGLPPLSDEDIALVAGWIAQGMPD